MSALDAVAYWASEERRVADSLQAAVDRARVEGASWQAIAEAGGFKSRQNAEFRFDPVRREKNRENAVRQNARNKALREAAAAKRLKH